MEGKVSQHFRSGSSTNMNDEALQAQNWSMNWIESRKAYTEDESDTSQVGWGKSQDVLVCDVTSLGTGRVGNLQKAAPPWAQQEHWQKIIKINFFWTELLKLTKGLQKSEKCFFFFREKQLTLGLNSECCGILTWPIFFLSFFLFFRLVKWSSGSEGTKKSIIGFDNLAYFHYPMPIGSLKNQQLQINGNYEASSLVATGRA